MSDKRIIEYDTASKLEDDDYLLLDSVTGGTCKILAKPLEPVRPHIVSIEAVYVQSGTVYDTDTLDSLKTDLTVTAYYDNETSKIVTDYTLSGTLEVGTSTITVSYKGFTDTFDVTVSSSITYLYNWDFTQSLTDSVQGVTATLYNATFIQGVGVSITAVGQRINFNKQLRQGWTLEIDLTTSWTSGKRFINANSDSGFLYIDNRWICYYVGEKTYTTTSNDADVFSGKTLKMILTSPTDCKVYADDTLVYEGYSFLTAADSVLNFNMGAGAYGFYNMTITGVRIYANT